MKINILKKLFWGGFASLVLLSCNALDITQNSKLSFSNMWKTPTDVETSTHGIYYRMRSNFINGATNMFYWGEARVGAYMWGPSLYYNVHDANMSAVAKNVMDGTTSGTSWSAIYTAIDQANSVLKYANTIPAMTEAQVGFALGQAHFARAYLYFWAARVWGDVPLNLVPVESTTQPESYPTRAPKADVYAQIKLDIEKALEYAQYLGSNKYLATKDAVNMLKAEYGLWMYANQGGDASYLSMAETALNEIGIGGARLITYKDIFDRTKKANSEVIFILNNNQTEKLTGGYYSMYTFPSGDIPVQYQQNPVPIYQTQWWSYSQNFVDVLLASKDINGDRRVDCNLGIGTYEKDGKTITWPNKFLGDMSTSTTVFDSDLIYYRYGQAVMMHAELKYHQKKYAEALTSLNLIAKRAYGVDNFYTDSSKDGVLEALTKEYFLEFPCEGVIWWALIRLDKLEEYNPVIAEKKALNKNILLWPVAKSAINKNYKLTQTEGWS